MPSRTAAPATFSRPKKAMTDPVPASAKWTAVSNWFTALYQCPASHHRGKATIAVRMSPPPGSASRPGYTPNHPGQQRIHRRQQHNQDISTKS